MTDPEDAFEEWLGSQVDPLRFWVDRRSFMAGAKWALEDAASEASCDLDPPCGSEWCGQMNGTTSDWLRERATGIDI